MRQGGETDVVMRWKPKTGEVWRIDNGAWALMSAHGRPASGDFDLLLTENATTYWTVLCDRVSGKSWQLANNQWQPLNEPQ